MNINSISSDTKEQIDLIQFFIIFWNKKYLIIFLTFLIGIFSIAYALKLPEFYKSQALVSIQSEDQSASLGSLASQFGGIASMAGISLLGGGDKTFYVIETIKSREFLKLLLANHNIKPQIMATDYYDKKSKKIFFYDNDWINNYVNDSNIGPSYLEVHEVYIDEILDIYINEKTGFINISVEHKSPVFAENLLSIILDELNLITKKRELLETEAALIYLNTQLLSAPLLEIKTSINNLIESQLNKQMVANIKEDFLLKVLDPPFIPEQRVRPSRAIVCISITSVGFFLILLSIFLHHQIFIRESRDKKIANSQEND